MSCHKIEIKIHNPPFDEDEEGLFEAINQVIYSERFSHLDISVVGRPFDCDCSTDSKI